MFHFIRFNLGYSDQLERVSQPGLVGDFWRLGQVSEVLTRVSLVSWCDKQRED